MSAVKQQVVIRYGREFERTGRYVKEAVRRLYHQFPRDLAANIGAESLRSGPARSSGVGTQWKPLTSDYLADKNTLGITSGGNRFFFYSGFLQAYFASLKAEHIRKIFGRSQVRLVKRSRSKKNPVEGLLMMDDQGLPRFKAGVKIEGVSVGGRFVAWELGLKSSIGVSIFPNTDGRSYRDVNFLFEEAGIVIPAAERPRPNIKKAPGEWTIEPGWQPTRVARRLMNRRRSFRPLVGPYVDWYRRVKVQRLMNEALKRMDGGGNIGRVS